MAHLDLPPLSDLDQVYLRQKFVQTSLTFLIPQSGLLLGFSQGNGVPLAKGRNPLFCNEIAPMLHNTSGLCLQCFRGDRWHSSHKGIPTMLSSRQ